MRVAMMGTGYVGLGSGQCIADFGHQVRRRGDGYADLSYVYDAAREIAAAPRGFTVVITKSTVPVGTGRSRWPMRYSSRWVRPLVAAHPPTSLSMSIAWVAGKHGAALDVRNGQR